MQLQGDLQMSRISGSAATSKDTGEGGEAAVTGFMPESSTAQSRKLSQRSEHAALFFFC